MLQINEIGQFALGKFLLGPYPVPNIRLGYVTINKIEIHACALNGKPPTALGFTIQLIFFIFNFNINLSNVSSKYLPFLSAVWYSKKSGKLVIRR